MHLTLKGQSYLFIFLCFFAYRYEILPGNAIIADEKHVPM